MRCGMAVALLLLSSALASCQSAPPPGADTKAVTVGGWSVKTSGYVREDIALTHGR